jgi:protein-disulfide isomerase
MTGGVLKLPVGPRDHMQGAPDAPVTLVEYGDYECPLCGRAHPVVKELQKRMGSLMSFAFRNFPLTEIHPHAEQAAEAAEAAATRGKFWPMHDMMFEHQWDGLEQRDLLQYAAAVGLDPMAIERDITARAYLTRIREDFMSGVRSGVNGTPTFFINGIRFDGDWTDLDRFAAVIIEAAVPA